MGRVQIRKFIGSILMISIISGALLFAPTGYLLVRPGSAENLNRFITADVGNKEHEGSFFLVTVTQQNASPALLLYGLLNPIVDLQQRRRVIPPDMDPEEYRELMRTWMEESQNLAKVIALRRIGYDVPIESDGVQVVSIGKESPAQGLLSPEDVIVAVDGEAVYLAEELVSRVQLRSVGEPVNLTVKREEETLNISIPTTTHTEEPDKAAIRVTIRTLNWQPQFPVEIDIHVGEITGPSAGLMFVLEILNQLDPRDLTAGQQIAGTGTIDINENVGSIGGVRQKVRAAENAGAQYFFVPADNFDDAMEAARHIEVILVETLDEALGFLDGLQ
jgi:PDZ domain-containing protein